MGPTGAAPVSRIIVTLAVDDVVGADPLGIKETVAMALEPLGQVRVLRVETAMDQQMRMDALNRGIGDKI